MTPDEILERTVDVLFGSRPLTRAEMTALLQTALVAYAAAQRERAITAIMLAGVSSRLVAEALFDQVPRD